MAAKKVATEKKPIHGLLDMLVEHRGSVSIADYERFIAAICDEVGYPKDKLFDPKEVFLDLTTDQFEMPGIVLGDDVNEEDFSVEVKVSYKGKPIKGVTVSDISCHDY